MRYTPRLLALILALLPITVSAQQFPTVPDRSVIGRIGTGSGSGPSQAIPFATLAAQLAPGSTTNVSSCGAVGNGTTDDAPAIRTCASQVSSAGGGIVQFSCGKTYLLGSYDGSTNGLLHPYSNVTYQGCGESSVLKVKTGMNTGSTEYLVFYPPDNTTTYNYSNIGFRDFKIDNNGANNGGFAYQNVNIGCNYCTGVTIQNVTFSNSPGSQYIQIGNTSGINATQVRIINNRFTDACDIINATCTDHSSIFIVAGTYSITGNTFAFSSQSTKATAIEMHGVSGTATGNAIESYSKSANIVAENGHTGKTLTFVANSSTNVRYGVTCWALTSQSLTDVIIGSNTFLRSQEPVGSGLGFIDCGSSTTITNANSANVKIIDNVISSVAAVGTAMTDPVIVIGRVKGLEVSRNIVNTSNGPCIGDNGSTLDATTRWTIRNNICIDTGATSTAASRRGILINSATTIDTINVSGNRIENVASTYMTTGIEITLNVTYGLVENDNQISNIATQTNVTGTGYGILTANSIAYSPAAGVPFVGTNTSAGAMLNTDPSTSAPSLTRTPVLGVAGSVVGTIGFRNATSGSITLSPPTGALGTVTLTLPAATDTLIGKATTDILTNKTYDTAGTGNVLKINGTTISAVTGSTSTVMLQTAPTFVTSMTGPLLIGGTGTTSTLTLQPTSGAGTTNADIIFQGGNNGATPFGRWQNDAGFVVATAVSCASSICVNSSTANTGINIFNGSGGSRVVFKWNTTVGGYFQIADTSAATSIQFGGTNALTPQYWAPTGGVDIGINTTSPTSVQTGTANVFTVNGWIKASKVGVGSLPTCNAANEGARMGVTDANSTTFNATAAAGGANHMPVYCNGTNWVIGANDNIPRRNYAQAPAYRRAA